ncbi:MAG TPA: transporter [Thioploca sp.]|nr:transporter [Thioploca sp.]
MKIRKTLLLGIFTFALAANSYATNGYFSHGYGAKSKSMAGACVAMAFGAMCGATTNPASLAVMGNRLDYGLAWFAPRGGVTAGDEAFFTSQKHYESAHDWFIIPHLSYNRMLDKNQSFGVFISTHRGINTEYGTPVFSQFSDPALPKTPATSTAGLNMNQVFMGLSYSRKLTERHSFGITPIFAIQTLDVQGLQPFQPFSVFPNNVTDHGTDISFGGGLRVGWLGKITDYLTLGASYQTPLWMSPFHDYKGLLAEEGKFNIPANFNLGLALRVTPEITLAVDYQRIEYGDINAMSNASDLVFTPGQTLLGTKNGLGFGWEDMDILKFGVEWKYSPDLTLRAGYSRAGNNAFPETQSLFNYLLPGIVKTHYSIGLGTPLSKQVEFNIAFTYAADEKMDDYRDTAISQTGTTLEQEQFEIVFSWGIAF